MYLKERMIDGELHYRLSPEAVFVPYSLEQMAARLNAERRARNAQCVAREKAEAELAEARERLRSIIDEWRNGPLRKCSASITTRLTTKKLNEIDALMNFAPYANSRAASLQEADDAES